MIIKFKGDLSVWIFYVALCFFSFVVYYSSASYFVAKDQTLLPPIQKQAFLLTMAFCFCYIIHRLSTRLYSIAIVLGSLIVFFLLPYTLFAGETLNEGTRWLNVFGVKIQPSEIAKIMLVMDIAFILSTFRTIKGLKRGGFIAIVVCTTYVLGFIFTENLSTALLILLVVMLMLFLGRVQWRYIGAFLAFYALLGVGGLVYKAQRMDTWFSRITEYKNSVSAPQDARDYVITDKNRQPTHARIAIASSNGLGVGIGNSTQRHYLSHAYSDFVFAIIAEEYGFVGAVFVLLIYLFLFFRVGRIAAECTLPFHSYLVAGLGLIITLQAFTHIAISIGFFPVTGQPLPMLSAGGTSMVIMSASFGIILAVSHKAQLAKKKKMQQLGKQLPQKKQTSFES